jgi:small GTP-binding protein
LKNIEAHTLTYTHTHTHTHTYIYIYMGCLFSFNATDSEFSELADDIGIIAQNLSPEEFEALPPWNLPKIDEIEEGESSCNSTEQFKVILLGDSAVGKSSLIQRYETNTFNDGISKTIGIEFSTSFIEIENDNHNNNNNNTSPPATAKGAFNRRLHNRVDSSTIMPLVKSSSRNHKNTSASIQNYRLLNQRQRVQLQLWDAAGELNYSDIRKVYYQGCHAVVLVYNVCDEQSFLHVKNEWLSEVRAFLQKSVQAKNNKKRNMMRQHVVFVVIANQIDNDDSKRVVHFQAGQEFADSINAHYFETSAKTGQNVMVLFHDLAKELHDYFSRYT